MYQYQLKNIRVVDGDTIKADILLGFGITIRRTIRLSGIDTPEKRTRNLEMKDFGMRVSELVEEQIRKHEDDVVLHSERDESGKYGRLLGEVYVANLSLNKYLLMRKYAIPYGDDKDDHLENIQILKEGNDSLFSG